MISALRLDNIASLFLPSPPHDARLMGLERAASEGFGEKRLSDFLCGRHCARKALQELGHPACEIPIGEGRQPLWPEGFCGSISHARGLAGAILSTKRHHLSLGLDIESRRSVERDIWHRLFTTEETEFLTGCGDEADEKATLFFSLKEAFYKLQYPVTGRFLDFHEVSLKEVDGGFRADWSDGLKLPRVLRRHILGSLTTDEHVVTYALLESGASSHPE